VSEEAKDQPASHEAKELARDREMVAREKNTARYFTTNRHVAWVALAFTILWGLYGYLRMPKAKDPVIEVRTAVASCKWPGASAENIEQLVTKKMEQALAANPNLEKLESVSRTGVTFITVTLREEVADRAKEWDDIQGRLDGIHNLPSGAGPIDFQKDFGDTATLMLTVASPKASDIEIQLRAESVARAVKAIRGGTAGDRATLLVNFPPEINVDAMRRLADDARRYFDALSSTHDARLVENPGFFGIDVSTKLDDEGLRSHLRAFAADRLALGELHPDVWPAVVIRDPASAETQLRAVASDKYTYHELDRFTDTLQRYMAAVPIVSKVTRTGVLPEQIDLEYSQERLAAYGVDPSKLKDLIGARNITAPGGIIEIGGKDITVNPSGEFVDEREIGGIVATTNANGAPVYLRDLVDVSREYQNPPSFLNYLVLPSPSGQLIRSRAVTLTVDMRQGSQINDFAEQVDQQLAVVKRILPDDLVIRRTSDQPRQVRENVDLFMEALLEAIGLVVLVAMVGFWEVRTALLLAVSIPITLAMTFGLMQMCGIDVQQVSIASLIIALGLLVDDPVVAADAIKHSLGAGWKPFIAAWLGPTKLATAIVFATITNIASYLPFLTVSGDTGKFIHSLPIVLSLSLVASRIVSMTFVPLLGSVFLRPPKKAEPTSEERRSQGFGRLYHRFVGWATDQRRFVFGVAVIGLLTAGYFGRGVKPAFFPKDLSYLSYVDIWLPEDSPLRATREKAQEAIEVIKKTCEEYAQTQHRGASTKPVLESITEFDGGGSPRFWFSLSPEQHQLNYAELVIQVKDKADTNPLVPMLQQRLGATIAGARIDVRQLETGKPVGVPVAFRISGEDIGVLRQLSARMKTIFRSTPGAQRERDDWGSDTFAVGLRVDPDRANLAGVTNLDVAEASSDAMNGQVVGQLLDFDRQINIVSRLRANERSQLADVENLYVASGTKKVPLRQVSRVAYSLQTEKIRRRNQFRTVTVSCFPAPGQLSSQVLKRAMPEIKKFEASLPPGYRMETGGEAEEQGKSFKQLTLVLLMLLAAIYLALVVQFKNAVKPLIVFAALPFGAAAALVALVVADAPFSFMAFLGIISLMGVIVSHIIVLFDFIEEMHERGEPMREALLDAGLMRLRPVLITVIATVLGLVPLTFHGGPLWEPLCYAQIGGLLFATVVTLVIVPVLYTILVKDVGWVQWEKPRSEDEQAAEEKEERAHPVPWRRGAHHQESGQIQGASLGRRAQP
jgi:multidrug efflux pump subunit AcrB